MLRRKIITLTAVAAGISVAGFGIFKRYYNSPSPFTQKLIAYYQKHYDIFDLPEAAIKQLEYLENSTNASPESNALLSQTKDDLHIEIKRSCARWHCLQLLMNGNEKSHEEFVASQPHDKFLSYSTFQQLSKIVNSLSPPAKSALKASCFIVKSGEAVKLAQAVGVKFSLDSEQFVTDTLAQCPEIYPVAKTLSPLSCELLNSAFMQNTHLRHMLYTEGGHNMFVALRAAINEKKFTREEYDLWFCRWLINIAGFRGHVNPRGSVYLDETIAIKIFELKNELDQLWVNPEHDVLGHYLKKRREALNLRHSNFLAHLACLMRVDNAKEVQALSNWVSQQDTNLEAAYTEFVKQCKITPTYAPALLDTLRILLPKVEDVAEVYIKLSQKVSRFYETAIAKKLLDPAVPMSFKNLASKEFLQSSVIPDYLSHGDFDLNFHLNSEGEVEPPIYELRATLRM